MAELDPIKVSAAVDALLAFLRDKLAEIESKLPAGLTLADEDLANIAHLAVGKFTPELATAIISDIAAGLKRGHGPNVHDPSALA